MRPFRVGRWGSQIHPLGHRHYAVPDALHSNMRHIRLFSTSECIGEEQLAVKRGRGRPPKSEVAFFPSMRHAPDSAAHAPSSADPDHPAPLTTYAAAHLSTNPEHLPSPRPEAARHSAKLAALHARLGLSPRVPIETLARTLVHRTADSNHAFNNTPLALLGRDLLTYYILEHLMAKYPRLPTVVLAAARVAYIGDKALTWMATEWGIEVAAAPGGEVDPGFLQFSRRPISTEQAPKENERALKKKKKENHEGETTATLERASGAFVQAVFGAVYVHCGAAATHQMFKNHILSRHLDVSTLFLFKQPTRDLSRLCAREGFESPIARLESESGRLSRHPLYVVGVYSGHDKLGEAAGGSLDEARFRAAASALKGWYLYSPHGDVVVPSQAGTDGQQFTPLMVDMGEVVA